MPKRTRSVVLADRWLLALLGIGLLVRVPLAIRVDSLWPDPSLLPLGDQRTYLVFGAKLLETGTLETGFFVRPPLYFVLAAISVFVSDLTGLLSATLPLRLLQCVASAATAIPVYRTAHRVGGVRAARLAAGFLLLDPTLVAYSHLLWPETIFLLLVAVLFDALPRLERGSTGARARYGALLGLAMLLKPVLGLFALLLAGWWIRRLGARAALRLVLVFGGAAFLVVAPWAVRNQLRYGPEIVLENQGPYNLWIGNDPRPPLEVLAEWNRLRDPSTRSRVAWSRGTQAIRDDPSGFARRAAARALNLWGFEFFVVRSLLIDGYGEVGRGGLLSAFWLIQAAWVALLVAAAAGLPDTWRDPSLRLLVVYAAVFTVLVAALVATTRFRVPFAFLLAVSAGLGADRVLAGRPSRRSLVSVGVALAILGFSAARPVFRIIGSGSFAEVGELRRWDWRFFRY